MTREELIDLMARAIWNSHGNTAENQEPPKHKVQILQTDAAAALKAIEDAGLAVVPHLPTNNMLENCGTIVGFDEDYPEPDSAHIAWYALMVEDGRIK